MRDVSTPRAQRPASYLHTRQIGSVCKLRRQCYPFVSCMPRTVASGGLCDLSGSVPEAVYDTKKIRMGNRPE